MTLSRLTSISLATALCAFGAAAHAETVKIAIAGPMSGSVAQYGDMVKAGALTAIEQINAAYSMGANRWQVIRHVVIPAALPDILTGMRIAIGFGWTTLVAAEMVAATSGLGQMVLNASNFLRTDVVIMGIGLIGLIAYTFDLLMRKTEKWLVPWKGRM